MPQASTAPGPHQLPSALLVLAPAPAATRFQPAAARLLTGVECELFPPRASAQTTSCVSLRPRGISRAGRESSSILSIQRQPLPGNTEKPFPPFCPLAEGKVRICPRSCSKKLELLEIKCRKHGTNLTCQSPSGLPLLEAFEGTVAHQSSITPHTVPQSMGKNDTRMGCFPPREISRTYGTVP